MYYFKAVFELESQIKSQIGLINKPVNFFVPTGNFGNVFAGFVAKQMGLNIKLSICVNENDTLYRFYKSAIYKPKDVVKTMSNAIDIANPSNFERILFYLSNNKEEVKKYMTSLRTEGYFRVSEELHKKFCQNFEVYSICEKQMLDSQKLVLDKYNTKVCPHTSIAIASAIESKIAGSITNKYDQIRICLATANYIKFE